jgi:hypothetical protein
LPPQRQHSHPRMPTCAACRRRRSSSSACRAADPPRPPQPSSRGVGRCQRCRRPPAC